MLCDSGYVAAPFVRGVKDILGEQVAAHIARLGELHTFKVMPARRVLERRFAWLEHNRSLWENCERLLNTSLQLCIWCFLRCCPAIVEYILR